MFNKGYWIKKLDKYNESEWSKGPNKFAEQFIKYTKPNDILLDVGCGIGQDSIYFAQKGLNVIAIDQSEFGLDISKKSALENGLNIEFKVMDISKLNFDQDKFDAVYAHLSLHYFDSEKTKQIFRKIHKILKPTGVFGCLLNSDQDEEIKIGKPLGDGLFEVNGLVKRFFSLDEIKSYTNGLFKPIVMDNNGETYKDKNSNLIRFIGKKI